MSVDEPEFDAVRQTVGVRDSTDDKRLMEFVAIWELNFGETLTLEEAASIASRLVNFYRELIRGTNAVRARQPVPTAAAQISPAAPENLPR